MILAVFVRGVVDSVLRRPAVWGHVDRSALTAGHAAVVVPVALALRDPVVTAATLEAPWFEALTTAVAINACVFVVLALVNLVQYDSQSAVMGWQSRFRWILTPGNDLYIVYTHNWLDDGMRSRFVTLDRRAASKVLYTYRF